MPKTKILVVEDESILAKHLKDILEELGYAVPALCASGEAAIEKTAEIQPDLVLMDIVLKGEMDGVQAAEHIREQFDVPLVYLTAHADERTLQRAKITEPFGYILKPYEVRELHSNIETALYKHRMERRLKENEKWLATVLKSIGDAVVTTDTEERVTFMNPTAEALTGWTQAGALGVEFNQVIVIVNEGTGEPVENPVERALRKGIVPSLGNSSVLIAKDGKEIPVEDSAAPIRDDKGDITGVVMVFRDITERRLTDGALRESEEFNRTVIEHSPIGISVRSRTGSLLFYNDAWKEIWAIPDEELQDDLTRKRSKLAFDERDRYLELHLDELKRVYQSGGSLHIPEIQTSGRRPGAAQWLSQHFYGIKDDHGEVSRVVILTEDITERKRVEEALQKSEEKYRSVVEYANEAIIVAQDGMLKFFNPRALEITGYTQAELAATPFVEIIHPEDRKMVVDRYIRRLEGEILPDVYSFRILMKEGDFKWLEISAVLIDWEDKPATLNFLSDITERKQAEEALHRVNRELSDHVKMLQEHNRQVILMNEMGDLLQSCLKVTEAYEVVGDYSEKLFPNHSGGFYALTESKSLLEAVSTWGKNPPVTPAFVPGACVALRRGQMHSVGISSVRLRCRHVSAADVEHLPDAAGEFRPYLCAPMSAHGETLGVLHLSANPGQNIEKWKLLATTVAERAALAVSNLKLREDLHRQSIHDALTGLFNRRYMHKALEGELHRAARHQRSLGIAMIDMDHLKHFNDVYGHEAGDEMLKEFGHFLQTHIRNEDTACRYGGDEFVVILPEASLEDTIRRFEKIREEVKDLKILYRGEMLSGVTITAGLTCYPEYGTTAEELLRSADAALYKAKGEGRDRVMGAE